MKINIKSSKKTRIEMLPLIDIVFLLLVFFIYAMLSMAVHRGIPVNLPASTSAEIDRHRIIAVTLKQDGSIYLDKRLISIDDLGTALSSLPRTRKDNGLLLFADGKASYQELFRVMDEIRHAGITDISLQAEAVNQP